MTYTLYAAPGACSRVPMMALEEAGADFDVELVRFMRGAHRAPDFLALNPAGKVPVLVTPDGPLTENVAIATYLAGRHPGLLPDLSDPYEAARITSNLAYVSSTLHPIVTRIRMPMFMADGDAAQGSVREKAMEMMRIHAATVDAALGAGPWWYGDDWSVQDAYVYWVWFRITGAGFPGEDYPAWAAHAARMEARASVQRALARDARLQAMLEDEGLAVPMR